MKTQMLAVATIISAGIVAGCGGGSGSSGVAPITSTNSSTSAISGKVADGYLVGATVFMDKNGNYQLDAGEPSATTDANGAYTLNVDPGDVGKYPIAAMVIKGQTIDKDNNLVVANSYVLSMPATAVSGTVSSNFISPMSTQVRELMETGKYTMQQAMDQLRTQLGLPAGTNMLVDYMGNPNNANYQAMHSTARNMASLMGSQMSLVLSNSGSTTTVDINRYRGMMGTIFSNMSSINGSSPNTQTAMSNLMGTMAASLPNVTPGQPFSNMSSSFQGGMMGGTNTGTTNGAAAATGGMGGATSGATAMTGGLNNNSTGSTVMTTGAMNGNTTGATGMTGGMK